MAFYTEKYLETRAVGMEVALSLIRINTNILNLEYLRRQSKHDMMGGYAKTIVSLSQIVDTQLSQHASYVDPLLLEFVKITQKLFKAVAIWSLLFPLTAKIKLEKYDKGEDFRKLASACVGFVNHIAALQHAITDFPRYKQSKYYSMVELYFSQVLLPKSSEVAKVYGTAFKEAVYDDNYYIKLSEKDYINETVGNRL